MKLLILGLAAVLLAASGAAFADETDRPQAPVRPTEVVQMP